MPKTDHHTNTQNTRFDTVSSMGLLSCHQCGKLWKNAQQGERCAHCNARLHSRKPNSINRTWALLITACIMYIPANIMPVMITSTFFDSHQDTILSGILFFWVSGEWGLASVVFIASFLVPLLKLASLFILLISAQQKSTWRQLQRAKLYRMIELIGRWSMLDVFVVSLLAGLVQLQGFAQINAGIGIVAFGAVVVLTMLASISFDPRLIWDAEYSQEYSQHALTHQADSEINNSIAKT